MNIKDDNFLTSGNDLFGFDTIDLKLPFEAVDDDDIIDFFRKKKIVPYAGNFDVSGDRLLAFYEYMAENTPTSSACISSKAIVSFGSRLEIGKRFHPIFDIGEENDEVSVAEKKDYIKNISMVNFKTDGDVKNLCNNLYYGWEANGNMWLEVEMYELGKERKVNIIRHEQKHVRYQFTKKEEKIALVSLKWDNEYEKENPPREVPIFPNAIKSKGVVRTMLHVKNTRNFWYGKPPSKGSILEQYMEYADMFYLGRLNAKEWTARTVFEVEDDAASSNRLINNKRDQNAGFKNTIDRFGKNFSNKSKDPSTFLLITRPPNSKPMAVHQMVNNTNERYYQKMSEIYEGRIIKSHSWSPRLLGGNTSVYFATGVYLDELKVKDATTNLAYQQKVEGLVYQALDIAFDYLGISKARDLGFKFVSPYVKIIENEKKVNDKFGGTENGTNVQNSQPVDPNKG